MNTRMMVSGIIAVSLMLSPRLAVGQRLAPSFPSVAEPISVQSQVQEAGSHPAPSYWLEGGLAGGIGLGVLGGVMGHGLCADNGVNENCTGSTLGMAALGAVLGFTVGALIGGFFPKRVSGG